MLRNQLITASVKRSHASSGKNANSSVTGQHTQIVEATIDDLYNNSRSGLRSVFMFLTASVIGLYFKEQSLAASLPANIMDWLGSTPPTILVNYVFGASTLSSLISIAGRIYHDREPGNTSTQLCFRVFFYLLYFISGDLATYFNVVFISGLVVLGLQHYNVWNYYMRVIDITTDKCNRLNQFNSRLSKK
jgi:hypothetical protein